MAQQISRPWACGLVALILMLGGWQLKTALASDHIDGEITKTEPLADLSDFYAFPTDAGARLALILNTYPIAHAGAHFSDRIGYAFVIRAAQMGDGGITTGQEVRITCTFMDEHSDGHSVRCAGPNGAQTMGVEGTVVRSGDVRLFFGHRSDPFFFDSDWALATSTGGALAEPSGENTMARLNVLTLALDIDRSLLPGTGLLALSAEAFETGAEPRPLDRIGRPEVTNVSLIHRGDLEDVRDDHNRQPSFAASDESRTKVVTRLDENIRYYDALDGQSDWSDVDRSAMVQVLADDFLIVDPAMPCGADAFLEIERSMLSGQAHRTCGGRRPEDDIMDRLYTLYIANDRAPVGDTVDMPYRPIRAEFPFLAAPERGFRSWLKTKIANWKAR
ncbi:MAG: DUF4331 family protein [Paracoccaceae bacterium]